MNKKNAILLAAGAIICLFAAGCSKGKANTVGPSNSATNSAFAADTTADVINSLGTIQGDSGVTAFAPSVNGAPAHGPWGLTKFSIGAVPDADGFYTVNSADFTARHARWKWADTLSIKIKMDGTYDGKKVDLVREWLNVPLAVLFTPRAYAPVVCSIKGTAENGKRKLESSRTHSYEMTGTPKAGSWITRAGGLQVTTTITKKDTGEISTVSLKNTDDFIPDGRGPHGVSIDLSTSWRGGRTAHFDLVRDNERASATFDNVSGTGWVKDSTGAEIAKIYFTIDGMGYYTLNADAAAEKHPFVQSNLLLKRV